MPNSNKHFTCEHPGCDKPATRSLTYFIDPPPPDPPSLDAMQDAFCDEHAETEMIQLQTPGFFTVVRGSTELSCTVNLLTNCPIERNFDSSASMVKSEIGEDDLL
jgi:hypothetical protein